MTSPQASWDVFTFDVGTTTSRPIVVDQHVSRVHVAAPDLATATTWATQMVMRPGVQMPTSAVLVRVEV